MLHKADALTRGELQFAIVKTLNCNLGPESPYYTKRLASDGSRDMRGVVQLENGKELPFAYVDGRLPIRDQDGTIYFDEEGYSPKKGGYGMSWPAAGAVVMVAVGDERVLRWTYPSQVLGSARHINDHRYLEPPTYTKWVRFAGLHSVVDLEALDEDQLDGLFSHGSSFEFFRPAVYIGHHTDDFLAASPMSSYAVLAWNRQINKVELVDFVDLKVPVSI